MRAFYFVLPLVVSCTFPHGSSGTSGASGGGGGGGGSFDAKPIIDDLEMPEQANAIGGTYLIQGTISFHDTDDTVHSVVVRVPVIGKTITIAAGDEASLQNEPLSIQLPADIPLGGGTATALQVTVVDSKGTSSDPRTVSVVLQ